MPSKQLEFVLCGVTWLESWLQTKPVYDPLVMPLKEAVAAAADDDKSEDDDEDKEKGDDAAAAAAASTCMETLLRKLTYLASRSETKAVGAAAAAAVGVAIRSLASPNLPQGRYGLALT
jgi:hypothetical protein